MKTALMLGSGLDVGVDPANRRLKTLFAQQAQAAVQGRGRAFLRPSGTEPVVRVTVEADDAAFMQDTLDRLASVVRQAAAAA